MEKMLSIKRFAAAIAVSMVIFLSTYTASNYISNKMHIKQIELVQNIVLRKDLLPRYVLTDRRFYDVSEKYIQSLLNSVFSFEILPTKELDTFLHIIININSEVEVLKFNFEGHNIVITLKANKAEYLDDVYEMLKSDEYFSKVSVKSIQNSDEIIYNILCEPKIQPPTVEINTDFIY